METGGDMPPIYFVQHHRAHAANAFFLSNFSKAAFLTADWLGELESVTKGIGDGNKLEIIDTQWMPHSLGMYYATFTQLLGYRHDNDEWKVMALSAAQVDSTQFEEKIRSTVKLLPEGRFELDQTYFKGAHVDQPFLYTAKLLRLLDVQDNLEQMNEDENWQYRVAKAMQQVAEIVAWHVLNDLWLKTKCENLVLSGGFFMNSVLNGKITEKTHFKNVYISHSPDDLGNSIGAALYVTHCIFDLPRIDQNQNSNLGPQFESNEIEATLQRRRIKYTKLENPERTIAELLSKGNVVALHQGRMEFGDRALGFRSILGDPRDAETKDTINSMIKYRESFRPFAPATPVEMASKIFDVDDGYRCEYMEKVVSVRSEWREKIPAVTHFDGSARLQTVDGESNPYFYKVIQEFDKLTGVPVVLNTSFNINGEPIVLSPDDAISTFFNSGLQYLVINEFLIKK
jgi:carbamoyltransferase